MKVIRSLKQMSAFSRSVHLKKQTIGFVPTMGALHAGHLSLIRAARRENHKAVVSVFVNPIQFAPQEDYKKYPRDFKLDARLCSKEGADVIFYPDSRRMYPDNYKTYVVVRDLSDCLCGKSRPGHFKGVATVVAKLLNIVNPDIAYFGQKDAQQAFIIKKMAQDLNMPVKIKIMPTVRDKDGLALSSRNIYLSRSERRDAVILSQALNLAKEMVRQGKKKSTQIIGRMRRLISAKKSVSIQYISIVDLENLRPLDKIKDKALIALAVYIGKTRLIDNIIVNRNLQFR
ncbi:MAG: pantoate--beta-alanine ligase [Candidatus Omnitrophica bacterium]|nr:pantoate--beta-alanine ligase [Candidatus Omnitrophota bacterium]MDD5592854.1 pantoate--beta-alanine ligase [Candidatus Omnitrophota bacterium]